LFVFEASFSGSVHSSRCEQTGGKVREAEASAVLLYP
jgi:hypothetical protein